MGNIEVANPANSNHFDCVYFGKTRATGEEGWIARVSTTSEHRHWQPDSVATLHISLPVANSVDISNINLVQCFKSHNWLLNNNIRLSV